MHIAHFLLTGQKLLLFYLILVRVKPKEIVILWLKQLFSEKSKTPENMERSTGSTHLWFVGKVGKHGQEQGSEDGGLTGRVPGDLHPHLLHGDGVVVGLASDRQPLWPKEVGGADTNHVGSLSGKVSFSKSSQINTGTGSYPFMAARI